MSIYFFPFVHTWKAGLYCCFRPDCHSKYVLAFLPEDILKMNNFAAPTVQVLRSTHHLFTFYHGVCDYNLSHCSSFIDVSLVKFFKVVSLVPVCLPPPPPLERTKGPPENQQKPSLAYVTAASHPVLTVSSSSLAPPLSRTH